MAECEWENKKLKFLKKLDPKAPTLVHKKISKKTVAFKKYQILKSHTIYQCVEKNWEKKVIQNRWNYLKESRR